jgi:hypothetical protein
MIPTSNLRQASIVPKTLAAFFHVPDSADVVGGLVRNF